MAIFSGNVLMANGDIISTTEYMIRDMEMSGTRVDFVAALEEMRRGEARSPAATWMYDAAKRNLFPTLIEVAGRNSHAVRMYAVAMLEEILAVWPVEVAPLMPPRKSTAPKPRGPPRTPPELRSLKASISFRADQKAYLARMKLDHRLSRLCQQAVDLEADMLDLPDGLRDDALEAAAASFFDEWGLTGSYVISQDELIQHEATSEEMGLDAEALGIPAGKLIPALQALWDLEKEYALRKAAVLRKYRNSEKCP